MRGAFQSQGVPVLKCPGCGIKVADGTAICPSCDYIIDASFISSDAPRRSLVEEGEEEMTGSLSAVPPPSRSVSTNPGTRGAPTKVTTSSGVRVSSGGMRVTTASGVRPKGASGTGSRPSVATPTGSRPAVSPTTGSRPSAPPSDDVTNIRSMEDIVRSAPPRASNGRPIPAVRPGSTTGSRPTVPPRRETDTELDPSDVNYVPPRPAPSSVHATGQIMAPEELAADLKDFLGDLGRSDKIVFFSAVAVVLSAFTPWKETAEDGDILGLMSLGIIAILGALGIVGVLAVRVRRIMPRLNVLVPWMAQLGLSIACVLWCLIFMKLSTDNTEVPSAVGREIIHSSSPSFGAVLALLGSLGCLAGTVLGIKEKPQP
ncbi:hypothetical protein ACN28S_31390 [Cystobacter fuscus]